MGPQKFSLVLCLWVAGIDVNGWDGPREKSSSVRVLGGSDLFRATLDLAGRAALQLLEAEECRRVFSDFSDSEGHTLKQKLDVLGQTAPEYLRNSIRFTEGSAYTRRCHDDGVVALTDPGSHVVMVCETQLLKATRKDARYVGVVIIHETLHTLGLPENPPSSAAITDQVLARCK